MGRFLFQDEEEDDRRTHCCNNRKKNICIEDWSSFPSEEFCPIRMIIEKDDADKFDSFLRKSKIVFHKDDWMLKYAGFEMCPYGILGKICHHRAYKCATLLLSRRRKVGSLMKLNIINCYGSYPIHDAAISLSASLVKLFLDRGASLDARSQDAVGITPLEYAVERLSCYRNLNPWSPRKSLFKLIITLSLPQMKEALETIDLLARVSCNSLAVYDTICSAVKRGQVFPVAVLLLLARDRVMHSYYRSFTVSDHELLFSEAIVNELAALMNQESALMGSKEHVKILQLCREKKELMIYLLQMIEIFDRAGPALKSYLKERTSDVTNEQVSYHVAELLEGVGFILSADDRDISDITSLDSSPKPDLVPLEAKLKQQLYDEEDDPEGIFFKPCREQLCRCDMRMPSCTTSTVFQRVVGTSFLYGHHRGFSSRAGPSIYQLPGMIPRRNIYFLTRSPNMPRGCMDSLDIRNCNALAETIFRVLDGRKVEKLNLEDTDRFRYNLENCLKKKFRNDETLTALEEKGSNKHAEERLSLPCRFTAALRPGFSFSLGEAFEYLDVKKISSMIFSAVKKGKA